MNYIGQSTGLGHQIEYKNNLRYKKQIKVKDEYLFDNCEYILHV